MSPEYAVDGFFSVKSDVYSFGVLVLEFVSGMKNRGFIHQDHHHNLLGHVSYQFLYNVMFMCARLVSDIKYAQNFVGMDSS